MAKLTIEEAEANLRLAEEHLKHATAEWHEALAADNVVEEMARRLYVYDVLGERDRDEDYSDWYEKMGTDVSERDRSWRALLIDSERDTYRERAKELLELAKQVSDA